MKRIIALLLTLVLLTGVFACASQEAPQSLSPRRSRPKRPPRPKNPRRPSRNRSC